MSRFDTENKRCCRPMSAAGSGLSHNVAPEKRTWPAVGQAARLPRLSAGEPPALRPMSQNVPECPRKKRLLASRTLRPPSPKFSRPGTAWPWYNRLPLLGGRTMRTLSLTALLLLAATVPAAPALGERPPKWEYGELSYRMNPGRPALKDADGNEVPAVP